MKKAILRKNEYNINNNISNNINCFCIASNFLFPYEISFLERESVDILFDKILASNNFYVALDEPITPQIYGNYHIKWILKYEIISPEKCDSLILKAIIRTSCFENEFNLENIKENMFNCIIPCKGFAAGDGILFEIKSSNSSKINVISNKVDIKYESSFEEI